MIHIFEFVLICVNLQSEFVDSGIIVPDPLYPPNKQVIMNLLSPIDIQLLTNGFLHKHYNYTINPTDIATILSNYIANINTVAFDDIQGNHSNEYTIIFNRNNRNSIRTMNGIHNYKSKVFINNNMPYLTNVKQTRLNKNSNVNTLNDTNNENVNINCNVNSISNDNFFNISLKVIKIDCDSEYFKHGGYSFRFGIFQVEKHNYKKICNIDTDNHNCNYNYKDVNCTDITDNKSDKNKQHNKHSETITKLKTINQQKFFDFVETAHKENYCNFAKLGLFAKKNLKNCQSSLNNLKKTNIMDIDINTKYLTFTNESNIFHVSCELGCNNNEEMKTIYQVYSYKNYGYLNSYNKLKISSGDCIDITVNKNEKTNQHWFNFIKRDINIVDIIPMTKYVNSNPNSPNLTLYQDHDQFQTLELNVQKNNKDLDCKEKKQKCNINDSEHELAGVSLLTSDEIEKCGLVIDCDKYDYYYGLQCNNCSCINTCGFVFEVQLF